MEEKKLKNIIFRARKFIFSRDINTKILEFYLGRKKEIEVND
jgi:hypothetical protein